MTAGETRQSSGAETSSLSSEEKWVILCALQMEARAIRRGIQRLDPSLAARNVSIEVNAIGINGSRLKPEQLKSADLVILLGLAGGLDPDLTVGDVVIDPLNHPSDLVERLRLSLAERDVRVHVGPIACLHKPALTPADKAALRSRTGAIAVEMEADRVRANLLAQGVSFLHARVISDSADQAIDPALLWLVDDLGRPRLWPLVKFLLTKPHRIGELLRLGRQAKMAKGRLSILSRILGSSL